jgi:hypothetical protein
MSQIFFVKATARPPAGQDNTVASEAKLHTARHAGQSEAEPR